MALSNLSEYIIPRAAIIGLAAGAALYTKQNQPEPAHVAESEEIKDPPEFTDKGRLLTHAELVEEYNNLVQARTILESANTTRRSIGNIANFMVKWLPGLLTMQLRPKEKVTMDDLQEMGIEAPSFAPLVDLGAFSLEDLRNNQLNLKKLKEAGIAEIIIMEDRAPHFFLNYDRYSPEENVPLNRHGNTKVNWTMDDFRSLIDKLHENGIRAVIGFWANTAEKDKNSFVSKNWERLKPLLPGSDDMNVMSFVINEKGEEIPFADYVVEQFAKLHKDFGLDGLFLGDGLMGFRSFLDMETRYDFSEKQYLWTDFYRRVFKGVTDTSPQAGLWAYDCLGKGKNASRLAGVSIDAITPLIDNYVFQSYANDAWGDRYMNLPDYTLERDKDAVSSISEETKQKVRYTVGLGDSVEHWWGRKKWIQDKHEKVGPHAKKGSVGVWSNELIRKLSTP
jgi:hypothetical protein